MLDAHTHITHCNVNLRGEGPSHGYGSETHISFGLLVRLVFTNYFITLI